MSCLGDARRDAILPPVFVAGEVAMEVLIPLLMAAIIGSGVQTGDAARLRSAGLWLVQQGMDAGRIAERGSHEALIEKKGRCCHVHRRV